MSIQLTNRARFVYRVMRKLGFLKAALQIKFFFEKMGRKIKSNGSGVAFIYKYETPNVHPFFKFHFLEHPAVNYENYSNAKIYHWIHHRYVVDDKPFIIEPNDHPLSSACRVQPYENIEKIEEVRAVYHKENCKKILVDSKGQMDLFEYYFKGDKVVLDKCDYIPYGLLPEKVDFNSKEKRIFEKNINYACLASDYLRKGVDLVLKAWFDFYEPGMKNKLYLACHNVPEEFFSEMREKNVIHIKKAPMTERHKRRIYRKCDVAIAPVHTDGGANVYEAMENGLAVITMRSQRSEGYNRNNNCIIIDVPFYFYDTDGYGIKWKTFDDFFNEVEKAKKEGKFEPIVNSFKETFNYLNESPEYLLDMCKRSYDLACKEFSIVERNAKLRTLYKGIIDGRI